MSTSSISNRKTRPRLVCHAKRSQAPLLTFDPGPTWIRAIAETTQAPSRTGSGPRSAAIRPHRIRNQAGGGVLYYAKVMSYIERIALIDNNGNKTKKQNKKSVMS